MCGMENVHRMVNEEKRKAKKNQEKEFIGLLKLGQTSIVSHSELFISSMNECARKETFYRMRNIIFHMNTHHFRYGTHKASILTENAEVLKAFF